MEGKELDLDLDFYILLITALILAYVCRRATPVINLQFFHTLVWFFHCNWRYYAFLTTQESLQT